MEQRSSVAQLVLEGRTGFTGRQPGFARSVSGEVVFNTGMVGYPEALFESRAIQAAGLIASELAPACSHRTASRTLDCFDRKGH